MPDEEAAAELFFREQKGLIISGAVKDMDNFNRLVTDTIENQIPAEGTPANSEMLIPWDQGVATRRIQQ